MCLTMSGSFRSQALSGLVYGQLIRRRPAGSICVCSVSTRMDTSAEGVLETSTPSSLAGKTKSRADVVELSRNSMADLLEFADYSPPAMAAHMSHFHSVVKQHLGPPPDANNQPVAKSFVTDDYGPIEFSLDWRRESKPLVRYIVEPLGRSEEEERASPIESRLAAARSLLHKDVSDQHGDHQVDAITALLWEHYLSVGEVQSDGPPPGSELSHDLATQIFLGWDLRKDGKRNTKSYIFPQLFSQRLRQPSITLLARLLPSLDPACTDALGKLLSYISSRPEERRPKLMLVATDVLPASHALQNRLKIYFRTPTFYWPDVLDLVGLGCDLPAVQAELYTDLWTSVTGAPPATTMEEARGLGVGGFSFLQVAFDLQQGHGIGGRTKLYIPARHLAPDDSTIAAGLENFLERRGYQGWQGYTAMIANKLCPHRPLSSRAGLQSYVSCSFKKHGDTDPSITAYIHQETYAPERFK